MEGNRRARLNLELDNVELEGAKNAIENESDLNLISTRRHVRFNVCLQRLLRANITLRSRPRLNDLFDERVKHKLKMDYYLRMKKRFLSKKR